MLFNSHILELLNSLPSLKDDVKKIDFDVLLDSFDNDKKHLPSHYRVVLPTKNGELVLHKITRDNQSNNKIIDSYNLAFSKIFELK
jgi:3-dehydroquinate synthetase